MNATEWVNSAPGARNATLLGHHDGQMGRRHVEFLAAFLDPQGRPKVPTFKLLTVPAYVRTDGWDPVHVYVHSVTLQYKRVVR
jgi:hypothetical protein